jgi:hypothetical protein
MGSEQRGSPIPGRLLKGFVTFADPAGAIHVTTEIALVGPCNQRRLTPPGGQPHRHGPPASVIYIKARHALAIDRWLEKQGLTLGDLSELCTVFHAIEPRTIVPCLQCERWPESAETGEGKSRT